MKIFNLDGKYNIVCNSESTRTGFRHVATLCKNGFGFAKAKCTYLNRTWEAYQFESVLVKIIEANFTGTEKEKYLNAVKYENLK